MSSLLKHITATVALAAILGWSGPATGQVVLEAEEGRLEIQREFAEDGDNDVEVEVRPGWDDRWNFEQYDMGTPPIANVPYVSDFVYPDFDFKVETDDRRIEYDVPLQTPYRTFYTDDWWDDEGVYNDWYLNR